MSGIHRTERGPNYQTSPPGGIIKKIISAVSPYTPLMTAVSTYSSRQALGYGLAGAARSIGIGAARGTGGIVARGVAGYLANAYATAPTIIRASGIAGTAGLLIGSASAGYKAGRWLDDRFGLSDKIAGVRRSGWYPDPVTSRINKFPKPLTGRPSGFINTPSMGRIGSRRF